MILVFLAALALASSSLCAQVKIEPATPIWGQPFEVKVSQLFPIDKLLSGDPVFVMVNTFHSGVSRHSWMRTQWTGEEFLAKFVLPAGCQKGYVYVFTREKWINFRETFFPLTPERERPLGAAEADPELRADLSHNPKMWWAYLEMWRLEDALGQIVPAELLRQLAEMAKEEPSPDLLRTLAYGYWVTGEAGKAFSVLFKLCTDFANSPYAGAAFGDAVYQTFKRNLTDYRERLKSVFAEMLNRSPTNEYFREDLNSLHWIQESPAVKLEAVRKMFDAWIRVDSGAMQPYYILATVLFRHEAELAEAEQLASKAIELSYGDRPHETSTYLRGFAYRMRASIREKRGNYVEALSDIRMAQDYTLKYWPDDLQTEAELWKQIGYLDKAEQVGLEAYRKGSLNAEEFVKALYKIRGMAEAELGEYFLARLSDEISPPEPQASSAPSFSVKNLSGQPIDLQSLKGEILVVNFWFTTCGPCIGEMPDLNTISEEFQGKVRFLAFATDPIERVKEFLMKHTFKYEIIPQTGAVAKAFSVESFPTHFIIDRQGRIIWKARGANRDNLRRLRMMLERLLAPAGQ